MTPNPPITNQALYEFRMRLLNRLREATIHAGMAHPFPDCKSLHHVAVIVGELERDIVQIIAAPMSVQEEKQTREAAEAETRKRVREMGVEELLMQCDQWNGSISRLLADKATPAILAGTIRIAIRKFLNLLDRCPPEALQEATAREEGGDIDGVVNAIGGWRMLR